MHRLAWRWDAVTEILPRLSEAQEVAASELKHLLNHDFMTLKDRLSKAVSLPELRDIEKVGLASLAPAHSRPWSRQGDVLVFALSAEAAVVLTGCFCGMRLPVATPPARPGVKSAFWHLCAVSAGAKG